MNAAAIALALVLPLLHAACAHSNGLDASICENFYVAHGGSDENDSRQVIIEVLQNDVPVDCFHPQTDYQLRLSSDSGVIKGFILQAVSGSRLPSQKQDIPLLTTWGPCGDTVSVSHTRARSSSSPDLIFPISTRKSKRPLVFRYSVVFSMRDFQQNRYWELPCCLDADHEIENTSNTTMGNTTASNTTEATDTPPELEPVENYNCGKTVHNINKTYEDHIHNGIRYNCTINKPLKQTECEPSCLHNDRLISCDIATRTPRRKGYMCRVNQDGQDLTDVDPSQYVIEETFDEVVTSNCQCHYTA